MTPSALIAGGRQALKVTRSDIIQAIRRWHALYGEPPSSADWNPSIARWRAQEWRIERYAAGDPETGDPWPSLNVVKRRFDGSFGAAVRAAGLEPHRPGPRRRPPGLVRPAMAERAPLAPRDLEDELHAAAERVRAAEARAEAAERGLALQARRADRADAALAESRARARKMADRARRARAARDRAEAAAGAAADAARARAAAAEERARRAVEVAAGRARVAEAHAEAAAARARGAEDRALAAIRTSDEAPLTDPPASAAGLDPGGPAMLAGALRRLARARATGDRTRLGSTLTEVASEALRWRDRL